MEKDRRILIFNVNWLGDVLFSTATIRNIRRNHPDSFIACIIPSRCYPVLKDNPYLDEVIIFDEKDRHKSIFAKIAFIRLLKYKKFDTAILLHGSLTRALICALAGIPQRIGYDTKKRGFLLTKKIMPPCKDTLHRIDYYLNIIEKAGLRVEDRLLDFFTGEEDEKFVEAFLKKEAVNRDDFLVGINPGGNWEPKRWSKDSWARLADLLVRKYSAKIIISGGLKDMALAEEIKKLMKQKPIISAGIFNLKQSAALFKKLDLFISADTGPMHIANAVGCKNIIAIFGPTDPAITGPFPLNRVKIIHKGVGCKIPCYVVGCPDNLCMKSITPEDILAEVKKLKV